MTPTPEMIEAAVVAVSENVDWVRGLFGLDYDNAQEVMRDALTAALALIPGEPVAWEYKTWNPMNRPVWDKVLSYKKPDPQSKVEDLRPLYASPAPLPVAVKAAEIEELEHRLATAYRVKAECNDEANYQRRRANKAESYLANGSRPLPYDREALGRLVREAWVRWAEQQPSPKPSWLVSYDDLNEPDKEADRQIGEAIARWTLIGDAAAASGSALSVPPTGVNVSPPSKQQFPQQEADVPARHGGCFEQH